MAILVGLPSFSALQANKIVILHPKHDYNFCVSDEFFLENFEDA